MSSKFLMQAVIEKTNVDPSEVGDIVVGTVIAPGSERAIECKMASFYAGFPGKFLLIKLKQIPSNAPFLHDNGLFGLALENIFWRKVIKSDFGAQIL